MEWKPFPVVKPPKFGRYLCFGKHKHTKKYQMQVLKWYDTKMSPEGYSLNRSVRWSHDGNMNPKEVIFWRELPEEPYD